MSHVTFLILQEMFDASLKDRELSFKSAPGTTMFLHWLVGMVYVFYFASFILLLREVRSDDMPSWIFAHDQKKNMNIKQIFL